MSAGAPGPAGRLEVDSDALLVGVRVVPRASRDALAGVRDGRLLVRLTAPPVEGRANTALVDLLARSLGLPRSRVEIVTGASSRTKRLRLAGASRAAVERLASGARATSSRPGTRGPGGIEEQRNRVSRERESVRLSRGG